MTQWTARTATCDRVSLLRPFQPGRAMDAYARVLCQASLIGSVYLGWGLERHTLTGSGEQGPQ